MSVVPDPYQEEQKAHRWMAGASLVETVAGMVAVALASLRLREALRESSIRDPLTGLFNRRYMEARLERELRRATRARLPLSLVVCDLDQFKPLNLRYGHEAGDMVLAHVRRILRETLRDDDVACRTGGEEFAVINAGGGGPRFCTAGERIPCQTQARTNSIRRGNQPDLQFFRRDRDVSP